MDTPVYAKEEVLDRVGGDKDFLIELTDEFLASFPQQFEELRSNLKLKDSLKVKQKAHSLKGALRNLGALKSGEVAYQIESAASEGDLSKVESIIGDLEKNVEEFARAYQDIKSDVI